MCDFADEILDHPTLDLCVLDDVHALRDDLVALRHELHQCPEVGLHLPRTLAVVRREVEALGLEIYESTRVSGLMAVLRGTATTAAEPSPTPGREIVLLRADMDGLPVVEDNDLDWRSTNGAMHACGHDLHMAGLIGAMRVLHARRDRLAGDVVFMFQPGEEGHDGARHMIEEGLLDVAGRTPDHAYGVHVWAARYPAGFIGTRPGAMMASSDTIAVTIRGRGGHGSAPHETLDPIPVIAEIITTLQVMVAREFNVFDPVVLTCGQVHAGSAANVIPDDAFAEFTLRAFSTKARERLVRRVSEVSTSVASAHGMHADIDHTPLYPVTMNDPNEVNFVAHLTNSLWPGRWQEQTEPMAAAEDFSRVLERIPGCFIGVSAVDLNAEDSGEDVANPGVDDAHARLAFNHSPRARFSDDAVTVCAALLAQFAHARLTSQ